MVSSDAWTKSSARHCAATLELNEKLLDLPFSERYASLFWAYPADNVEALHYVNAGHANPLLFPADCSEPSELIETGPTLGVILRPQVFQRLIPFGSGDVLLVNANPLLGATSPDGEAFGAARLASLVRRLRHLKATEIREAILAEVREFCGEDVALRVPLLVVRRAIA